MHMFKSICGFCVFVVSFLLADNAFGFVVHGSVKSFGHTPISGAKIYETYKEEPVAVTDADGLFSYETGSDSMVEIHAEKQGYFSDLVDERITKDSADVEVSFKLKEWWEKNSVFKIYVVHEDDKNCILNYPVNISVIYKNRANDYAPKYLSLYDAEESGLVIGYPNSDGAVLIEHMNPAVTIFVNQVGGAQSFGDEPDDVYYRSVPQAYIDRYLDLSEDRFNSWQEKGYYKEYTNFEEYKKAQIKDFYKFCPSKQDFTESKLSGSSVENHKKKSLDELNREKDEAREREQSTVNKMLGGASIGSMGMAGMELASAISEKQAIADAEQAMRAYLSTFVCRYDDGHSVRGGETNIELPGGNELLPLVTEYKQLAADLKLRKEALGIMPGIESEQILDKANTGLYDDEGLEQRDGAFTSVSRALMDETSQDATDWVADKDAVQQKIKTSAIAAGVSAGVSLLGNILTDLKNTENNPNLETSTNNYSHDKFYSGIQPKNCSYSECLAKLTISDATKAESRYSIFTDFCAKQFPDNPDCIKIMLIYSTQPNVVLDIDTLIASNFDMEHYQSFTRNWCDDKVCNDTVADTTLFSDSYNNFIQSGIANTELKNNLEKCFKIAGAANYFDLPTEFATEQFVIDFDNLDCTKLDEGKNEQDIHVLGTNVTTLLRQDFLFNLRKLLGKQAHLITVINK